MRYINEPDTLSRRGFVTKLASGIFVAAAGVAASSESSRAMFLEELAKTPSMTEGPFYPRKMPLDTDNDLIVLNNNTTEAIGEVTHLSGKIMDSKGSPVRNALVEIWQCDSKGIYLAETQDGKAGADSSFQGYGKFVTGTTGDYYFRTIKPVPYSGRPAPHIHVSVKVKGKPAFVTQCFINGFPGNAKDGIYNAVNDPAQRKAVSVDFRAIKASKIGELAGKFDIVLGWTPEG